MFRRTFVAVTLAALSLALIAPAASAATPRAKRQVTRAVYVHPIHRDRIWSLERQIRQLDIRITALELRLIDLYRADAPRYRTFLVESEINELQLVQRRAQLNLRRLRATVNRAPRRAVNAANTGTSGAYTSEFMLSLLYNIGA